MVYMNSVPNQRAPGQKLLPIAVDEKFLRELDAGLAQAGYRNRSQFIRDAIVEKLKRAGVSLPNELALPPNRIGKSGDAPAKFHYPAHKPSGYELNERAAPKKRR
jgi:Arc/MetJ-type ribon-helix-helix transcriptional regulator